MQRYEFRNTDRLDGCILQQYCMTPHSIPLMILRRFLQHRWSCKQ